MTHLKIGLLVDTDVVTPTRTDPSDLARHVVEMGVAAEAAGFDGVFFPDRHMRPSTLAPSQLVNAAAVAARTSRVDVGSYCSVLPLYNPMEFAEAWAAIDQLSGGRAVVAVGTGYNRDYLRAFGLDGARYRRRFVEAVEVVRRAWTQRTPWSYEGEIFRFDEVRLLPGPARAGGPPLWIAGQGHWAVSFAAENGDGFAGDPFPIAADVWRERAETVRAGAARRGLDAAAIVLLRHVYLTGDPYEADRVLEEVCLPQFRFYEDAGLLRDRMPAGVGVDLGTAREATIVGDATRCSERLLEIATRHALTHVILKIMRPGRLTPQAELDMVAALGRRVIPILRD